MSAALTHTSLDCLHSMHQLAHESFVEAGRPVSADACSRIYLEGSYLQQQLICRYSYHCPVCAFWHKEACLTINGRTVCLTQSFFLQPSGVSPRVQHCVTMLRSPALEPHLKCAPHAASACSSWLHSPELPMYGEPTQTRQLQRPHCHAQCAAEWIIPASFPALASLGTPAVCPCAGRWLFQQLEICSACLTPGATTQQLCLCLNRHTQQLAGCGKRGRVWDARMSP
jgi:hypothetical protein